jgi:hypothetical protein
LGGVAEVEAPDVGAGRNHGRVARATRSVVFGESEPKGARGIIVDFLFFMITFPGKNAAH